MTAGSRRKVANFTLMEVLISLTLIGLLFGTVTVAGWRSWRTWRQNSLTNLIQERLWQAEQLSLLLKTDLLVHFDYHDGRLLFFIERPALLPATTGRWLQRVIEVSGVRAVLFGEMPRESLEFQILPQEGQPLQSVEIVAEERHTLHLHGLKQNLLL